MFSVFFPAILHSSLATELKNIKVLNTEVTQKLILIKWRSEIVFMEDLGVAGQKCQSSFVGPLGRVAENRRFEAQGGALPWKNVLLENLSACSIKL